MDDDNWINSIQQIAPDILIHSAWQGINEADRKNWEIQFSNFEFSRLLFDITIDRGVSEIIAIGSQAEYGISSSPCSEEMVPSPVDAYGLLKLLTCNYLNIRCQQKRIPWYWLRVFSVFGPGENTEWLIPQVIIKLLNNQEILLTEGRQQYDYLYIDDLTAGIKKIIQHEVDFPGIYNICSGKPVEIRKLLVTLAGMMDAPSELLKFGALPYRDQQNMFIVGDCGKFKSKYGEIESHSLLQSLSKTLNHYKNFINN